MDPAPRGGGGLVHAALCILHGYRLLATSNNACPPTPPGPSTHSRPSKIIENPLVFHRFLQNPSKTIGFSMVFEGGVRRIPLDLVPPHLRGGGQLEMFCISTPPHAFMSILPPPAKANAQNLHLGRSQLHPLYASAGPHAIILHYTVIIR